MKEITKKYSNEDITIVWKPSVCMHSTVCWRGINGLSSVFNPTEKPWIKPEGASTERIIQQVNKCPSGALSYYANKKGEDLPNDDPGTISKLEVSENGPLLVYGEINIKHKNGTIEQRNKVTAFCRCGQSGNKPFCDGSHVNAGFKG